MPPPGAVGDGFNSADRLVFWTGCKSIATLDDAGLDLWKSRGVDGFICAMHALAGLGGPNRFGGPDGTDLTQPGFEVQRLFSESRLVERARERGIDVYLSFYLANASNTATPLKEWFDDEGWSGVVVPRMRDLAKAAKEMGFAGIAFDQELYPQAEGVTTATWSVGYPGGTHPPEQVRAKARERGAQVMGALIEGYPDLDLLAYATQFPESWEEEIQREVNGIQNALDGSLQIDFWDGLTSVEGWNSVHFLNATFYKTVHLRPYNWDDALRFQYSNLYALLSQRFSNWDYAADRVNESPFSWISSGTSDFEKANSPGEVAEQLDAFSRWGMGRLLPNYAHENLEHFDYSPYLNGMRAASTPRDIPSDPPYLSVDPTGSGRPQVVSGEAADDYAVRFVSWEAGEDKGMARMVAQGRPGGDWSVTWETPPLPASDQALTVTITVEGIKGDRTQQQVTIPAGG